MAAQGRQRLVTRVLVHDTSQRPHAPWPFTGKPGTVIDSGYGDRVRSAQLTRAALLQNVVAQYVICQTLLGKCVPLLGAVHGSA